MPKGYPLKVPTSLTNEQAREVGMRAIEDCAVTYQLSRAAVYLLRRRFLCAIESSSVKAALQDLAKNGRDLGTKNALVMPVQPVSLNRKVRLQDGTETELGDTIPSPERTWACQENGEPIVESEREGFQW